MDILSGINDKSVKAFRYFFEEYFPNIVLFADKYLDHLPQATDVAQECFIRLWHTEIQFESLEKLKGFLYTTARNISLNELKHNKVVSDYAKNEREEERFFRDSMFESETYQVVYDAIGMLAPQAQKVILLSLQGDSNTEIAEKLKISVNSVRTHKQNAYRKLKGLLKDYFYLFFIFR